MAAPLHFSINMQTGIIPLVGESVEAAQMQNERIGQYYNITRKLNCVDSHLLLKFRKDPKLKYLH